MARAGKGSDMTAEERQEIFETLARVAAGAVARDEGRHQISDAIAAAAAAALVQIVGAKSAAIALGRAASELRSLAREEQKLGIDPERPDYAIALATEARDQGASRRFRH
jgi:hypothetical protein